MAPDSRRPFWAGEWAQTETALVVGVALLLTGLFGLLLVPEAAHGEGVGLDGVLNGIHLVAGLLGVLAARYDAGTHAGTYNRVGGVAYLALGVAWLLARDPRLLGLEAGLTNAVIYLLLGLVLAATGFGLPDRAGEPTAD